MIVATVKKWTAAGNRISDPGCIICTIYCDKDVNISTAILKWSKNVVRVDLSLVKT